MEEAQQAQHGEASPGQSIRDGSLSPEDLVAAAQRGEAIGEAIARQKIDAFSAEQLEMGLRTDPNRDVWVLGVARGMVKDAPAGADAARSVGAVGCDDGYVPDCARTKASGASCCARVAADHESMVATGSYIMRPGTLFTAQLLQMVETRLTQKMEAAVEHASANNSSAPGVFSRDELYGDAFLPLQSQWKTHVRQGLPGWDLDSAGT